MWLLRIQHCLRCNGSILSRRFVSSSTSSSTSVPLYDVVVAGGGMVGASMVAALGHSPAFKGKKILLLEGAPLLKPLSEACKNDRRSSRVVAVSPKSVQLLDSFGAWQHIVSTERLCPVRRMHVWESCSSAAISFDRDTLVTDLAYIVENDVLLGAVCKQLENIQDTVEIKLKSKIQSYGSVSLLDSINASPHLRVHLDDGSLLDTRLLVGADGFNSLVRRTAGIDTIKWDYDQQAVVAVVNLDTQGEDSTDSPAEDLSSHNDAAWQRFLPNGPLALLPLTPTKSCMIWTTTPAEAKELVTLDGESFVDAVNHALWTDEARDSVSGYMENFLDGLIQTASSVGLGLFSPNTRQLPPSIIGVDEGSRATFPLGLCHSRRYIDRRMALIGDAAHRIHPLAGQGVNLGFGDVECLRDKLVGAIQRGADLGSRQHLLDYERSRRARVLPMMAVVDALNRVYSNSFTPAVVLRSTICKTLDSFRPLNNAMIKFATN